MSKGKSHICNCHGNVNYGKPPLHWKCLVVYRFGTCRVLVDVLVRDRILDLHGSHQK